ncbi:transcriptional repressor [Lachnospiraceae bacterium 62-35]
MRQKEQIMSELQKRGKRITEQRRMLLDIILEGNWNCCKELYYEVSKRDPSIGLATVYRMVAVLEEIGVLSRRYYDITFPLEEKGKEICQQQSYASF